MGDKKSVLILCLNAYQSEVTPNMFDVKQLLPILKHKMEELLVWVISRLIERGIENTVVGHRLEHCF